MRFISANLIGSYNVVQSGTIYADKMVNPTDEAGSLELSVGDTVQYLRYYGEGFGAIRYEGADYVVDLREVEALSETPTDEGMEHAWVRLDCDDEFQTEAWLFLGDLQAHEGVGPANITGFGEAPDATAN